MNHATDNIRVWLANDRTIADRVAAFIRTRARVDRIVRDECTQHGREYPLAPAPVLAAKQRERWAYETMRFVSRVWPNGRTPDGLSLNDVDWLAVSLDLTE